MAPDQFLPVFPFPSGRQGDVREAEFDSVQPKVTLSWRPNEDWTIYGTYAEGFRSGGFNLSGVAIGVATLVGCRRPGLPQGVRDSYDQEDTEGFEIGFKSSLARRRAALGRRGVRHGGRERLHVRVRRTVHGADDAQHQVGRRQRPRDEPLVARDGAPPARLRFGLPRLRDHRERLGRGRRHQHHRQGDAAKSRSRRRTSASSIAASSAASATGTRGSTIGGSARSIGSPRTSSRAIRCRSSTCGSASRSPRLGSRRLGRQRDGRGLDLRGVEPERHRLLRQAAAVRGRAHLPLLKTLERVEGESG